MELTKCEETSFVQLGNHQSVAPKTSLAQTVAPKKSLAPKVCNTSHGFEINFADKAKQDKLERMMTPGARKALDEILGRVQATQAKEAAKLLQQSVKAVAKRQDDKADDDDDDDD